MKDDRLLWIDTDTGVDDSIALLTALDLAKKNMLQIAGISAVCGNAGEEKTFLNARNVLYFAGREDIPVYHGARKPLMKAHESAYYVHGENGLGGVVLPPSPVPETQIPAWDALYECARKNQGKLELVLLGPETNAAIAFQKYPDLSGYLKRILIMGGAEIGGNRTAAAEFNIYSDPHAAQIVFKSGVQVVMCGLDVTMKAMLTQEDIRRIESLESRGTRFFMEATRLSRTFYREHGYDGYFPHDVCPVLYSVYPEKFTAEPAGVFVETRGNITLGKTVSDRDTDIKFGVKNAVVVLNVDRPWFADVLTQLLADF